MTIYLDIVMLENICMNYIILFTTGYIMKNKIRQWRLIASATIGGIYAIVSYLDILPIYSTIVMKIILSIIMVYIGYKAKSIKVLIKQLIIFYLTSFVFGGCAFALLYFIRPQDILVRNGIYIGTYPLKIALLGGIIGFVITQIAFKIVKTKFKKKDMIYNVKISIENKTETFLAMLDTGNLLKDPITKIPVIIVEKNKLYSILPDLLLDNVENLLGGEQVNNIDELGEKEYLKKIRILPFSSIGKQKGIMLGIKADWILIEKEESQIKKDAIIGISMQKIGNGYSALFGLDLLEGSEENEFTADIKA